MNNIIDLKSRKDEIISAATEAMDYHIKETSRLKKEQRVLFGIIALLVIGGLL